MYRFKQQDSLELRKRDQKYAQKVGDKDSRQATFEQVLGAIDSTSELSAKSESDLRSPIGAIKLITSPLKSPKTPPPITIPLFATSNKK